MLHNIEISPLFIAELSAHHLGMRNIAKQLIKKAKEAGAHYVKIDKKIPYQNFHKEIDVPNIKIPSSIYTQSFELSEEDFCEIDYYCKSLSIDWYAGCETFEALDFFKKFEMPFYEINITSTVEQTFVEKVLNTAKKHKKNIILKFEDFKSSLVQDTIKTIIQEDISCILLFSSQHIQPKEEAIETIQYLKENYKHQHIKIGYSGDEKGYSQTILAATKGINIINRKFTLSKNLKISSIEMALTPKEFCEMTKIVNEISQ